MMRSPERVESGCGPLSRGRSRRPDGSGWPPRPRSCPGASGRRDRPLRSRRTPSRASLVEADRVEHVGGARHQVVAVAHRPPDSPPAAPVIGSPRGSRGRLRPARPGGCSRRSTIAGIGALLGPEDARGVLEGGAHVAQHVHGRRSRPPPRGLERARAAVRRGRPAHRHDHLPRRRPPRRPRSARRCRAWRRPTRRARPRRRARGRSPGPSPPPRCRRRRGARSAPSIGRPRGSETVAVRTSPPRRAEHLHRPLAAVGDGSSTRLAIRRPQPGGDRRSRPPTRREGPLESSRGRREPAGSKRLAEGALRILAVHREDDPLERAVMLSRRADHDPRRLLERKAADAGAERDECERAAPSSSAFASVERVARSMISAEVGPPSSMVAAWITQRHGMSPAVVSTASPSPIGARSSDSRCTSGPPAREIAPATPPP